MYRSISLATILFCFVTANAQENSPFSRYGLGDLYPQQNIAARAMGGLTAAFTSPQAINTVNPASYGNIPIVTFDVGITIDQRTLKSSSPALLYNSANFLPSYVVFATPLSAAKGWGAAFGIKPATRINYSVQSITVSNNDSLQKLYEGNGGLTRAFIGLGKTWGKLYKNSFSLGINGGFEFGKRETNNIINYFDSVPFVKSNFAATTNYSGFFINPGVQVGISLGEKIDKLTKVKQSYVLRLGASANLQHNLKASMNSIVETFGYDANGAIVPFDTISMQNGLRGTIKVPLTYNAGFMISDIIAQNFTKWSIGADYSAGQWSDYRFYGQPDQVVNNWTLHTGAEFTPDPFSGNLFASATYRAGFYTGKDYINADGNGYDVKAFTFGLGFNLKKYRGQYDNQRTLINTAFEIGKRGGTKNNISENFFKLSVGLSLSDFWFIKRKYD